MKKFRPVLIGFVIGGGISTKIFQLVGQSLEINSMDLLSVGMIIGGLVGAVVGLSLSTSSENTNVIKSENEASEQLRKSA